MIDVYTQGNGSKKKFLAPVLVILLCMVSLTAAGYAYSATIDNSGDDVIVDGVTMSIADLPASGILYTVDDLDIATHTTNGKAIWWAEHKAFDKDTLAYNAANPSVIANSAPGYYVEMLKNDVTVGFHDNGAIADRTEFNTKTADEATATANGLFKIGAAGGYTLSVVNQSKVTVDVKAIFDFETFAYGSGVNAIYLAIDGTDAAVDFIKVADGVEYTLLDDVASRAASYDVTITAYIALSDFHSAGVPAVGTDGEFSISFEAVTAA